MEKALLRLRADLVRLDATIESSGGVVRAYTPVQHPAPRGAVAKAILDLLRQAKHPMGNAEIVTALSGQAWAETLTRRALTERVRVALGRQAVNGVVRCDRGLGRPGIWSVSS
jgi:hypothetical protein